MKKSLWTIYCRLKSLLFSDMTIAMATEENTIIFKNGSIIKVIPNEKVKILFVVKEPRCSILI